MAEKTHFPLSSQASLKSAAVPLNGSTRQILIRSLPKVTLIQRTGNEDLLALFACFNYTLVRKW